MKKKLIYLSLYLLSSVGFINAQTADLNLQKYFTYRERLLGDDNDRDNNPGFIKRGLDQGMSIVCPIRVPLDESGCEPGSSPGKLKWGDAMIKQGQYIAMLAAEWYLLNYYGQDKSDNELELYQALKAVERVDYKAEEKFGLPGSVNGFFFRDDVPNDFHQFFGSQYGRISSSWTTCNEECPDRPTLNQSMSQDQAVSLIFGFRFVKKLVNATININGTNLHALTESLTDKIINYIKTQECNPPGSIPCTSWWIGDPNGWIVCHGYDARSFAYAIAKAGNNITGNNYQNAWSITEGQAWWGTAKDLIKAGSQNEFNAFQTFQIAVAGDAWSGDNSFSNAVDDYEMYIFDLAHSMLNGNSLTLSASQWESIFNTAPCKGPCFDQNNNPVICPDPGFGWMVENRWERPSQSSSGSPHPGFHGQFSGIDYMLAYNLYRIAFINDPEVNSLGYGNLTQLSGIIPNSPEVWGSKMFPLKTSAYKQMQITAVLNNDVPEHDPFYEAHVEVRAGEEINLIPGFWVKPGAFFHGYIEPYSECNATFRKGSIKQNQTIKTGEKQSSGNNIDNAQVQDGIYIYPNPSANVFHIKINTTEEAGIEMKVFDITGKLVSKATRNDNKEFSLNLEGFNKGLYFLKIKVNDRLIIKKLELL